MAGLERPQQINRRPSSVQTGAAATPLVVRRMLVPRTASATQTSLAAPVPRMVLATWLPSGDNRPVPQAARESPGSGVVTPLRSDQASVVPCPAT